MTYCVAVMLDAGIVFASDSRTNAGVDQIAIFRKMHVINREGDRLITILSSGNLSITQSAINLLESQMEGDSNRTVLHAKSMYEIADMVGNALREVRRRDGPYLQQNSIDASASFLVGGQIRGEPQRLFHVYSEGNFIEATRANTASRSSTASSPVTPACSMPPSACWCRSIQPCAATYPWACRSTCWCITAAVCVPAYVAASMKTTPTST
jgi:20S proteasome alpha/beta subunit